MGSFSRLRYVIAANVNALIEKAEDPEKLLRALIREMEDASEEARMASADLLAEQQHHQRYATQLAGEIERWEKRAELAVMEGRDDLARVALKSREESSARLAAVQQEQSLLVERNRQMEQDMQTLKAKLGEAKLKLKSIHARQSAVPAGAPHMSAAVSPSEKRVKQALGRFDRLQTQVENMEARVRSYDVGGPAPVVWDPVSGRSDPAVEAALAALKQKLAQVDIHDDVPSDASAEMTAGNRPGVQAA